MATWERDTAWRQGHVVPSEAAKALELLPENSSEDAVAVVISHDCDLAQAPSVEPHVEMVIGSLIAVADGNFTYAKNARRLHVNFDGGANHVIADLAASRKISVEKVLLAQYAPMQAVRLAPADLRVLQRWLAARYRRSAFPDEFDRRLESTGLRERLGKILKSHGALISAIFFDVDDGEEILRSGADDPYALRIYLLFSTETDPDSAETAAASAALAINNAFRNKCLPEKGGPWRDIELVECEAISDQAMTVQQAESLKRWNAEYLSLRTESPQKMLNDE